MLLPVLLAVRLYSLLRTQRLGAAKQAKRSFSFVLRLHLRTSTGMKAAQGILTVRGGMTSHAAVVARGMGTCCVSGCGDIKMDEENKKFELWQARHFVEGD